jgi:hypothetical protein
MCSLCVVKTNCLLSFNADPPKELTTHSASGSKSDGENYLDFKMEEGADLNILEDSDIEDIQSDPAFLKVVSNMICSDLNNYGFQVCQQGTESTPAATEQQPAFDNIVSLFEDGNTDESDDDEENSDENDNEDNDDENNN